MARVLILHHVWENHKAYVGELLDKQRISYDVIDVEEQSIPDPASYAAVIAFGGSQHVYEDNKYPYFKQEKAMIRQIIEQDIPYLGICLGAQLLANALGGQVRQHSLAEIGFYDVQLTAAGQQDALYSGLPGYQKVFHWHEDTFELPPGATLLATSANTTNQAFRVGQRAYGIQYHIEIDDETLDTWLYHPEFKASIVKKIGQAGHAEIEVKRAQQFKTYQEHSRILVGNFLKMSGLSEEKTGK